MKHNAVFHQGLHCLLRLKQSLGTEIHHNLENSTCDPLVGLPRLRNLVNVYTSSNNRNDSIYTELPDLNFSLCRSEKSPIFFLENVQSLVRMFEIIWLGVVIEHISSNWKVIATCADWYITDISSVASV